MSFLAFDIESVPLASSLAVAYPDDRQPPSNYKSDEAITKWRASDESSWRAGRSKECSLNPRLGRVVAIAYTDGTGDPIVDVAKAEGDEAAVLAEFWSVVTSARQIAGWNSMGFDLHFLAIRSLLNGVMPGFDLAPYMRRYSYTPHLDVKCFLLQWNVIQKGEGLDEWAAAFGIEGKAGHGSEVAGMVERGEWDQLVSYAGQDVRVTHELAMKVAPMAGVA